MKIPRLEKAEDAVAKAEREYNALINQQVEFTAKEREILDSIGGGADKVAEGSIEALEKTISKLRAKYKEATTDKERAELLAKIKEQEALLKKWIYPARLLRLRKKTRLRNNWKPGKRNIQSITIG